jgi:uncharacterized SAM-binding protein YcdF (DUF218 family)
MSSTSPPPPVILLPPSSQAGLRRTWLTAIGLVAAGVLWMTFCLLALPRQDTLPDPAPRVVIALGAGVKDDSTLTSASATRLQTAIAYTRAHNAQLVTTRAQGNRGQGSDRAQREMISAAGLADRWTSLPNYVTNTRDEALALHGVIPDTQPIAVVTSPLHTRRACATFERVGYRVTCLASAQYEWWRLPYSVAYETAAYVKYKRAGWW